MIITWNSPYKGQGLHVVPNPGGNDIILNPGANEVPVETWKKCRPHVLDRIEKGHIVEEGAVLATENEAKDDKKGPGGKIVEPGVKVGDLLSAEEFSKMSIPKATELVGKTVSRATLDTWMASESRGAVVKAINDQLKKLADKAAGVNQSQDIK